MDQTPLYMTPRARRPPLEGGTAHNGAFYLPPIAIYLPAIAIYLPPIAIYLPAIAIYLAATA